MVTMTDIALKAGVSRTAVSHVLGGSHLESVRISEATRQRILEAADSLGYRPNQLARAVALGKTRMIGYLVDEPRYEPYWNIMVGALEAAQELGFTLKLLSVSDHTLAERVRQCTELRLGGLVARVSGDKSLLFEEANNARIPVVTVDEGIPQPFGTRITSDDAPGMGRVLEHLTKLGHRKIAFIGSGFPKFNPAAGGPGDIGTAREALFRQEMAARRLELPAGYVTHDTVMVFGHAAELTIDDSSAQAATNALLTHPEGRPSAICCWRDETALFAIRACQRQGWRVPQDISVVGFADISAARLCEPPLSTVKTPLESIGRMAIEQLAQRMDEAFDPAPATHLVPTTFIARASSGPAPPS
ncbi:MAG: LacI family transcriptional regulator [Armatimonadota bacterium]|nr:LacI family transcriptional regulator [Armatimonadota bacterium]